MGTSDTFGHRPHRVVRGAVAGLVAVVGCSSLDFVHRHQADKGEEWGETLPDWTWDAPEYLQLPPSALPRPASHPDPDFPRHYYVRDQVIPIERPDNGVAIDRVPRAAVYWTSTNGCLWTRAGFFGLGQTQFFFMAGNDADYGIRFVGPGIRESLTEQTLPHRIYHLDRQPPLVSVTVMPDCALYQPGQEVDIHWFTQDRYLDEQPCQLAICWSWENPDVEAYHSAEREWIDGGPADEERELSRLWRPFPRAFEAEGSYRFWIPEYAGGEGLQFQVRARDRAGNYGVGYSHMLLVEGVTTNEKPRPADEWTGLLDLEPVEPAEASPRQEELIPPPLPEAGPATGESDRPAPQVPLARR